MMNVSRKQQARQKALSQIKKELIEEAIETRGYISCLCGKSFSEDTAHLMHLHHERKRSLGGTDERTNLTLLCLSCHQRIHNQ